MKAEFNNCFIIFYLLIDFLQNISLFLRTVSGYKQMVFVADAAQKVDTL